MKEQTAKKGLHKLLLVKDSDLRIMTLEQGLQAVDKGIHSGGAFSAVVPLTALYYGGYMNYSVKNPTAEGQDMFVLSKGHAVASMASIYADLGYFDKSVLDNSRSHESLLNGHPGPILPGVHISTGPLGQGCCVAQGYAIAGTINSSFNVFSLLGDGELQEGIVWESVMHAAHKKLDNLCFIVDKNHGQLDRSDRMILPMDRVEEQFKGFGWRVISVDGTKYEPVCNALETFTKAPRDGRPTVIICNTKKGFGAFSQFLTKHKVTLKEELTHQEIGLQRQRREQREHDFLSLFSAYRNEPELIQYWKSAAEQMNLSIDTEKAGSVAPIEHGVVLERAEPRNKSISYRPEKLPRLDPGKAYSASDVITDAMKEFALDRRIISIDADLGTTSGLQGGVEYVDQERALNVGIAEANMMNIGEAFASLGYNTWISTFCPFFDIKVLRRIAIGQQERLESIDMENSWLSEGHGMDLTFLATAPNLETKTNGATHMGNDDIKIINEFGSIRIIDVSCPNQLLGIMKWIMEGNKGLVYIRIMRSPSSVIYQEQVNFEYGKGYYAVEEQNPQGVIVSSGRGVFEAMEAARKLKESKQISVSVIDMPSADRNLFKELYASDIPVLFAEHNNGYLWNEFQKECFDLPKRGKADFIPINTSDNGRPQYIHSATYEEMIQTFGLDSQSLANTLETHM